jgi:excisionase family DNA binding protein
MAVSERNLITLNESERPALKKIEGVLNKSSGKGNPTKYPGPLPKLVGPDGDEIELPVSVFQILKQVVSHMMLGRAVSIVPVNQELTTQEAADLLNVSRPYLVSLLEEGKIPFVKVGTHRRVSFSDLMAYKKLRYEERLRGLAEIAHISEDEGLYD